MLFFFPLYYVFGNPLLTVKDFFERVRDTQAEKTWWQWYRDWGGGVGGVVGPAQINT